MNIEYEKIKEKYDIELMMKNFRNFTRFQNEIQQEIGFRGMQTIVIDIENTLIT